MGFFWLTGYAYVVARAGDILRRPAVRATLDRVTGLVLIGFGLRLALE
jgi:threonine/homoserine/homoserine lactone efflux protein